MTNTTIATKRIVELEYQRAGPTLAEFDKDHPERSAQNTNQEINGTPAKARSNKCRPEGWFGRRKE